MADPLVLNCSSHSDIVLSKYLIIGALYLPHLTDTFVSGKHRASGVVFHCLPR